jgi:hypothetical protein
MTSPTVLLDLNSTYASNASQVHQMFKGIYNVSQEVYRSWLTKILRDRQVLLLTSRPSRYQHETMERIMQLEGWQPKMALFNSWRLRAPDAKDKMLRDFVFPAYGTPDQHDYLAIESNIKTREMYARHGIRAITQQELGCNRKLLDNSEVEATMLSLL